METKCCIGCKVEKASNEFSKDAHRKDGKYPYCKTCKSSTDNQRARTTKGQYRITKSNAKRRSIEFSLSFAEFEEIRSKPCSYCQSPLNPTGSGIDRLDSSKGYVPGNCAPCCRICNIIKTDLGLEELHSRLSFMLLNIEALRARLSKKD